jgi:prolyl 4-hydroxylase
MKKTIIHDHVFLIEDFLSKEECDHLIAISEEIGFEEAKVQTGGGEIFLKGARNNDRLMYINEQLAEEYWQRAKPFLVPEVGTYHAIGLNEMFRFYRYTEGQRFKMHIDGSYDRNESETSHYTFLIYLNDDYQGGETEFRNITTVLPKAGTVLVFYHPIWHEGKTLIGGVKYALRTDVMYRMG